MADNVKPFLHMDDQWMWRFFFLDHEGKLVAISTRAYFTRAEAKLAMDHFRLGLLVTAT